MNTICLIQVEAILRLFISKVKPKMLHVYSLKIINVKKANHKIKKLT